MVKRKKVWLIIIALIALPILYTSMSMNSSKAKLELEREFNSITPSPQSNLYDFDSSEKLGQVMIIGYYQSNLSFEEINNYYLKELIKEGWSFKKKEQFKIWGNASGGEDVIFTKGRYTATLSNSGIVGDKFTFDLSWNYFK